MTIHQLERLEEQGLSLTKEQASRLKWEHNLAHALGRRDALMMQLLLDEGLSVREICGLETSAIEKRGPLKKETQLLLALIEQVEGRSKYLIKKGRMNGSLLDQPLQRTTIINRIKEIGATKLIPELKAHHCLRYQTMTRQQVGKVPEVALGAFYQCAITAYYKKDWLMTFAALQAMQAGASKRFHALQAALLLGSIHAEMHEIRQALSIWNVALLEIEQIKESEQPLPPYAHALLSSLRYRVEQFQSQLK